MRPRHGSRSSRPRRCSHVDLLVVLPVDATAGIHVPDDEDPELREAMDAALLDLVDEGDLVGGARVLELTGSEQERLARVSAAIEAYPA